MFVLVLDFLKMKHDNNTGVFKQYANTFQNIAAHVVDSFFEGRQLVYFSHGLVRVCEL